MGVPPTVSFSFVRLRCQRLVLGLLVCCGWGLSVRAQAEPAAAPKTYDELVYKDGDKVRGHLVREERGVLIFQSVRFGELHVPVAEATVVRAQPQPPALAGAAATKPKVVPTVESASAAENASRWLAWGYLYPTSLAKQLRSIFGPWQGRFAFSTEIVSDTTDHTSVAVETKLQRKWAHDDVQLNARYDYAETNNIPTTDLAKFAASWRHDLSKRLFTIYNPAVEWNRDSTYQGVDVDYVLLHQEAGAGVALLNRPTRQLRVGLSENRFDVWLTAPGSRHTDENVESLFIETEWQLPWRISITERGVYYYSFATARDGWENRFQIDKKLTETLSVGVQHEMRYNNPDVRVSDYNKMKFMVGLDF